MSDYIIRPARPHDVLAMRDLINGFADEGLMLHRSLSEIYENIRDYQVAVIADTIVGCSGLHVSWRDLAEVKSLAVARSSQGRGIGKAMVLANVEDGKRLGIKRVFALTYVPDMFTKMGFSVVDKAMLPRKVWTECVFCPKFPDCGEIAVLINLSGEEANFIPLSGK